MPEMKSMNPSQPFASLYDFDERPTIAHTRSETRVKAPENWLRGDPENWREEYEPAGV